MVGWLVVGSAGVGEMHTILYADVGEIGYRHWLWGKKTKKKQQPPSSPRETVWEEKYSLLFSRLCSVMTIYTVLVCRCDSVSLCLA